MINLLDQTQDAVKAVLNTLGPEDRVSAGYRKWILYMMKMRIQEWREEVQHPKLKLTK